MRGIFIILLTALLLSGCSAKHTAHVDQTVDIVAERHIAPGSDADLYRQAFFSPSFGGETQKGFLYRGRSLLVVFKCYTSGVATSEPFVFVQTSESWHCLYHHDVMRFEMDATVEGDKLVLWRLEWPDGKLKRSEFWSYDLKELDAV